MYRLVVLCFTLFAVAVVRPSPIYTHLPPAAISHQSRLDIIESKPIVSSVVYAAPDVHILENVEETHQIVSDPFISEDHEDQIHDGTDFADFVAHSIISPENHEELPISAEEISIHHIEDSPITIAHETPVVLLEDHINEIHPDVLSSEIHPVLSSEIHSVLSSEIHPVLSSVIHPVLSSEINPALSSEVHEHLLEVPDHEVVQQISVSSHSIHQTHDSPASTAHAIPVVLLSSNLHDSEEIHSF